MSDRSGWVELLGPWDAEFAIVSAESETKRVTFADTESMHDQLRRVLTGPTVARACWKALQALVQDGRLPARQVTSIEPMAREWLAGSEPERGGIAFITASLLGSHPGLRGTLLASCPQGVSDDVVGLVSAIARLDAEQRAWDERWAELSRGAWPADATIVQVAGSSRWGAYLAPSAGYGWNPALVDEQFLNVLRACGAGGWTAKPIDVRTRDWAPRTTHQALFVLRAIPMTPPGHRKPTIDLGALPVLDPCLAVGNPGIFASPTVAAALAAADLPGLELAPASWGR